MKALDLPVVLLIDTLRGMDKRTLRMWIPNQHGAWAMALTPAIVGTLGVAFGAERFPAAIVWLLIAWLIGYCAFFAFGQAARARTVERRRQYMPPVLTYGAISLVAVTIVVVQDPSVLEWAWRYAPLVWIAVWETLQRRPRSLASGAATTVASALLVAVIAHLAGLPTGWSSPAMAATTFLALYFTGTVPLVKTMVRDRGSSAMLAFSIGYHVVAIVVMVVYTVLVGFGWWMVAVLVLALARAVYFPLSARRGKRWTAKDIGKAEVVPCVLAALAALGVLLTG